MKIEELIGTHIFDGAIDYRINGYSYPTYMRKNWNMMKVQTNSGKQEETSCYAPVKLKEITKTTMEQK